ncbi:hypothetical protein FRC18_006079 [Serendipita sp. 400]|nr:hypothetical protein FRC18_006079 [Serendipita sp. 400]
MEVSYEHDNCPMITCRSDRNIANGVTLAKGRGSMNLALKFTSRKGHKTVRFKRIFINDEEERKRTQLNNNRAKQCKTIETSTGGSGEIFARRGKRDADADARCGAVRNTASE